MNLQTLQTNDENHRSTIDDYLKPQQAQQGIGMTLGQSSPAPAIPEARSSTMTQATKGLSLSTPSSLALSDHNEYKAGNWAKEHYASSPYDVQPNSEQFMEALIRDTGNKMIGSVPKIGEGTGSSLKTAGADGVADTKTGSKFGKAAMGAAGQVIGETLSALKNTAVNDYQNDLNHWLSQGKFWFDPNSELKPNLDEYLEQMPSATDALGKGTVSGGKLSDSSGGKAALGIGSLGISAAFKDKKQAEYIWNSGGEGAASGATAGGWVGAIVGGLVGVVKGVFTWGSAKDQDSKNYEAARVEYERKLKEWTISKNKRTIAQNEFDTAKRNAAMKEKAHTDKMDKAQSDQKKELNAREKRSAMKEALLTAGNASRAYRQRRLNRQAA